MLLVLGLVFLLYLKTQFSTYFFTQNNYKTSWYICIWTQIIRKLIYKLKINIKLKKFLILDILL
jgi:hypothetical protein